MEVREQIGTGKWEWDNKEVLGGMERRSGKGKGGFKMGGGKKIVLWEQGMGFGGGRERKTGRGGMVWESYKGGCENAESGEREEDKRVKVQQMV